MEKRACIFDMDGVLASSEKMWLKIDHGILTSLVGLEIANSIGDTTGVSLGQTYAKAVVFGATITKEAFMKRYSKEAKVVYAECSIATGIDACIDWLVNHEWKIGVLSSSPLAYIDQFLSRVSWKKEVTAVVSVCDNPDVAPKPSPAGYLWMMQKLEVKKEHTVAIEDSNTGILSAKSASIFTIGYQEFLNDGYVQHGAHVYAKTMIDVQNILEQNYL